MWDTETVMESSYQAAFSDSDHDDDDAGDAGSSSSGSSEERGSRNVEGCLAPPDSPQPSDEGGRRNIEGCLAPPDSLQPSDEGGSPSEHDLTEPTVATKKSTDDSCEKDASAPELVHFFQAADGQHLYLHPINARCLMKEYGKLEYAPQEIRAQIVELEQHSMTKEGRSRFRFLSHLPLTCQIVLCELNLKPPLLSKATLEEFAGASVTQCSCDPLLSDSTQ